MRLRSLLAVGGLLVAVALTAAAPAPANAADVSVEEALTELDVARVMVDEAVRQYAAGDAEAAYTTARNAYLDHFEYVEVPLRVRDEGLTLALEEDFAALRNQIEDGAPVATVRATAAEVQKGLDDVERALSEPRIAAPLIAAFFSFTILFREGVEAALIVSSCSRISRRPATMRYSRPVWSASRRRSSPSWPSSSSSARLGVAPAEQSSRGHDALVVAAGLPSLWMLFKMRRIAAMSSCAPRVGGDRHRRDGRPLGFAFTAVIREGIETALFSRPSSGSPVGWRRSSCSASRSPARPWPSLPGPSSVPGAASRFGSSSALPSSS